MDRDIIRFLIYFVIGGAIFVWLFKWVFTEYVFF